MDKLFAHSFTVLAGPQMYGSVYTSTYKYKCLCTCRYVCICIHILWNNRNNYTLQKQTCEWIVTWPRVLGCISPCPPARKFARADQDLSWTKTKNTKKRTQNPRQTAMSLSNRGALKEGNPLLRLSQHICLMPAEKCWNSFTQGICYKHHQAITFHPHDATLSS